MKKSKGLSLRENADSTKRESAPPASGWRIYEWGGDVINPQSLNRRVAQTSIIDVCVSAKLNGVTMARCHIRPDTTAKTIFTT